MSSHEGSGDETPIRAVSQLIDHHARGERPRDAWKVGTEHEKFALSLPELKPLKYRGEGGEPGILSLLDRMKSTCGWQPQVDNGELIALASQNGSISLEPGGQVELSGKAYATVFETREELDRHLAELRMLSSELPVRWLWLGFQPVHDIDDIGWMPKRRYHIMREYLPTRGRLARYMMQATCTVQANLDWSDERDMGQKLRTAMGVSSIVTAMFSNSPFARGVPNGYKSYRAAIWLETDADRTGLLPFAFDGELPTYEQYVRWAYEVPLFFILRGGEYLNCAGLPFSRFVRDGFMGHHATLADWEMHLSTLFPDVRLKTYLETRTADLVEPDLICALPALWKGLLYDEDAALAAFDVVRRWSFGDRIAHREVVPRLGMAARTPAGHLTADLAQELVDIARASLGKQAQAGGIEDESVFLEPLAALVKKKQSPADVLLKWYAAKQPTPRQLVEHCLMPLEG
ncbi:MAG: glutamate--cysteine ligase [Myxococcales bacterium]|nr:glutamate--cysteine ligase [Myxococcales bacterium]MCB9731413.1 glutamate--cysteine ligase [Deltaproteobacteria bacterium]